MKVLIVAKTRQGSAACIGGINAEGRSVRLIAHDAATNEHAGMQYAVGDVWELVVTPPESVTPPHVENVVVHSGRRLGQADDPVRAILKFMPPVIGGPDRLFQGLVQAGDSGALYIAKPTGVPTFSTGFWQPDRPLHRVETSKRIRYCYDGPDGKRSLVFVGFQDPPPVIEAGALVRVSLAHWWRSPERPGDEQRCYVQLSGWFSQPIAQESRLEPVQRATMAATGPAEASAPAPGADMDTARQTLKSVFGHNDFRPLQAQIIGNILAWRDTLAVMPTGSGKSLCYQLPALLLDGLAVVVSPLVALMQDQVDQLRELGVPAAFLNHTLDYAGYGAVAEQVRAGRLRLLYVAPETLLKPETQVMLDRARPALFVIDEAHCISSWGHDFRPEYRRLLPVRRRYPDAVCAAFTATATPRVQRDIQEILGFTDANAFIASFRRENLFIEVQLRKDGYAQVLDFLRSHAGQSGIIYCGTRSEVDEMTAFLAREGFAVAPYHAGLDPDVRARNQRLFQNDEAPIVVATIAFGLGINKPNVRFVINYTLPENIETYYQEIGRAGRDGLRADCLLLYSTADMGLIQHFINGGAESERAGRQARLQAMARYAETGDCRRALLLDYFGEQMPEPRCGFCDNCLSAESPGEQVDVTDTARLFLQCMLQTGQNFGRSHVIHVLRGSRVQKVLRFGHDKAPAYGLGKAHSEAAWIALAEQLIRGGYVEHEMEHGTLRLTDKGRAVLSGERVLVAAPPVLPVAPTRPAEHDAALFEQLRALRRELADAAGVPPYMIFSDVTLTEMATFFPQSPESLLALYGVGRRKLDQYGERFLALIRAYCAEHGLAEKPWQPRERPPERPRSGNRAQEVGDLFAAGETIEALCARYGVVRNTIINHLYRYQQNGGALDSDRLLASVHLPPDEQARALAAFDACGPERLTPIYEALDGAIPYEELHLLRLYLNASTAKNHEDPV